VLRQLFSAASFLLVLMMFLQPLPYLLGLRMMFLFKFLLSYPLLSLTAAPLFPL
jgi:hypothetical protein